MKVIIFFLLYGFFVFIILFPFYLMVKLIIKREKNEDKKNETFQEAEK